VAKPLRTVGHGHNIVGNTGHASLKVLQLISPELFQLEGKWSIEAFGTVATTST
jgi:hypothetical protein